MYTVLSSDAELSHKINELCSVWGKVNTHGLIEKIKSSTNKDLTSCSWIVILEEISYLVNVGSLETVDSAYNFYLSYKETIEYNRRCLSLSICYLKYDINSQIGYFQKNFGIKFKWWQKVRLWIDVKLGKIFSKEN